MIEEIPLRKTVNEKNTLKKIKSGRIEYSFQMLEQILPRNYIIF